MMNARFALPLAALTPLAIALAACSPNATADAERIQVSSTDDDCIISSTTVPSGSVVFDVTNDGSLVTEFYVYHEDGTAIVAEVENIGPGTSRQLVVALQPGEYVGACKPGMEGDGIRVPLTVTPGSNERPENDAALSAASVAYVDYVREQVASLVIRTQEFADAYLARDDDAARDLYPRARAYWESIEPVAESFGDLDPRIDLREADLGTNEQWTGWHHAEKDLWPPAEGYALTDGERSELAQQLLADTQELADRVSAADFTVDAFQIGNGAKELLDEIASGKVTGEEEAWSHTDLWDVQANVDGARKAFEVLRPVVDKTKPELVGTIDKRFDALEDLLATYGSLEEGFVFYNQLTHEQVLELARAVDALAEPLAQLTAAAVL